MDTDTLTPDAEESAMRELGQQTDAEQGREPVEAAPPQDAQATPETEPSPDLPPPPPERDGTEPETPEPQRDHPQQRPRDPVTGKFEKPETDYTRAQKEQERKDRSWAKLQAEKEQFRMAQTQWEEQTRMQQLEAARQNYAPLKHEGLTAQEYYEGAVRFEKDGDSDNALKAYKIASEMGQAEYGRYQQMQQVEAEYQWRMGMQQASQRYPDLWKQENPQNEHLMRIVNQEHDWLYQHPRGQGFQLAADVANMLTHEGLLKEKDDEIVSLKAQLEKYQRKGQPAKGGFAAPRTGDKEFDEMDLSEMESHLKGLTAEADNWR